jgi:hypothetical protein
MSGDVERADEDVTTKTEHMVASVSHHYAD